MEKQKIQPKYIGEKETGRYLHDDGKEDVFNTTFCQKAWFRQSFLNHVSVILYNNLRLVNDSGAPNENIVQNH